MNYPSDEELKKTFGKRIKHLRKKFEYSQSELSALADIDKGSLQRIERGYNPTLKTFRRLANAFGISLSELFDFDDIEETSSKDEKRKIDSKK
ncbi:MAG: helix-turn-helix domain-containing protein [Xanthomarina gelatinilytica]|uniref:helix-turn-helix domain-containing protein n=1 Tax=Xanthomarina gelatinilytica TaxID=1137281 RepID=UPI003A8B56F8